MNRKIGVRNIKKGWITEIDPKIHQDIGAINIF